MLKYLYCKEVFAEVPEEITLGISISGVKYIVRAVIVENYGKTKVLPSL